MSDITAANALVGSCPANVLKPRLRGCESRETHFLSVRTNERQTEKVGPFREWLLAQVKVSDGARAVYLPN